MTTSFKLLPTVYEASQALRKQASSPKELTELAHPDLEPDVFADPEKRRVLLELAEKYSLSELRNIQAEASAAHDILFTGTVTGLWSDLETKREIARIETPTGQTVEAKVGPVAWGGVIGNLSGGSVSPDPAVSATDEKPANTLPSYGQKFLRPGQQVILRGSSVDGNVSIMETTLPGRRPGEYTFEATPSYYPNMLSALATAWHGRISEKTELESDDIGQYRTSIPAGGVSLSREHIQQVAHLSRIGYGFGANARANGDHMSRFDVRAMTSYAREHFQQKVKVPKSVSGSSVVSGQFNYAAVKDLKVINPELARLRPSGEFTLWSAALRRNDNPGLTNELQRIDSSQLSDNAGLRSIYEDIYALAHFAEDYALTLDPETLRVIESGIDGMLQFYYDPVNRGFFTHLDANLNATSPDGTNKYNWNSIGDHLPAYLFSLLTALGPSTGESDPHNRVRQKAVFILTETTNFITDVLAQPVTSGASPFVNERLNADLSVDANQFDFAPDNAPVLGHNMKIVWNMIRSHNALLEQARYLPPGIEREKQEALADKAKRTAITLAEKSLPFAMGPNGESYDLIDRKVEDGFNLIYGTKDAYWQSEQMIFAMFSMLSVTGDPRYLELARLAQLQYAANHLDVANQTVHFASAGGQPVYNEGQVSRPDKGYHETELAFYSEVFNSIFVTDETVQRHLWLSPSFKEASIPVLPDFLPPGSVELASASFGNEVLEFEPGSSEAQHFRIALPESLRQQRAGDVPVTVTFRSTGRITDMIAKAQSETAAPTV